MNLCVLQNSGNFFLTSWGTVSFSGMTMLHGFSTLTTKAASTAETAIHRTEWRSRSRHHSWTLLSGHQRLFPQPLLVFPFYRILKMFLVFFMYTKQKRNWKLQFWANCLQFKLFSLRNLFPRSQALIIKAFALYVPLSSFFFVFTPWGAGGIIFCSSFSPRFALFFRSFSYF